MISTHRIVSLITQFFIIISVGAFVYLLTSENLLQQYTARAACMFYEKKLIATHLISDLGIWIAYMTISGVLYWLYRSFKAKDIPFKGFFWMFAGFIFLCGITHLIGAINIFITFYWLDGIVKLLTCWFSIAVAIEFFRAAKNIRGFKTPQEYKELADEIEELKAQLRNAQNGK